MRTAAGTLRFSIVAAVFVAATAIAFEKNALMQGPFRTFYCAGQIAAQGADPYRTEPLGTCEHRLAAEPLPPDRVEPAPLPGYALAFFSLLAVLPLHTAAALFTACLVASAIISSWLLSLLLARSAAAILLALIPLTFLNIAYGEVAPLALAGIVAAGYAIARQRWTAAGICAVFSLIEPHLGLAAVAGVFFWVPRGRVPVAASLCVLGIVTLLDTGLTNTLEYATAAMPAQAAAEVFSNDQFSLTRLLFVAGIPAKAALSAGAAWYAAMLCAGIVIGKRTAEAYGAPELIAFVPAAAIVFGGVYVHDVQILGALPAALVLLVRSQGFTRWAALAACALLAPVWTEHFGRTVVAMDVTAVLAIAIGLTPGPITGRMLRAAAAAVSVCAALFVVDAGPRKDAATAVRRYAVSPTALAATAWREYLRATPGMSTPSFGTLAPKAPIWGGAVILLVAAGSSRMRRRALY